MTTCVRKLVSILTFTLSFILSQTVFAADIDLPAKSYISFEAAQAACVAEAEAFCLANSNNDCTICNGAGPNGKCGLRDLTANPVTGLNYWRAYGGAFSYGPDDEFTYSATYCAHVNRCPSGLEDPSEPGRCLEYEPDVDLADPCDGSLQGDPINVTTGNLYEHEVDWEMFVNGGSSIERVYNSASSRTGMFGPGWFSRFDVAIVFETTHNIVYEWNGRAIPFVEVGGQWIPTPEDVGSTLIENGDGSWTFDDGSANSLTFDATGRVLFSTEEGRTTSYAYVGDDVIYTDPFGNTATIVRDTNSRVEEIQLPGGSLTLDYQYDGAGNLTSVMLGTASAVARTVTYQYTNPEFPNALTARLVDGSLHTSWTFDAEGRATSSARGGGNDLTTFEYTELHETEVTNALGLTTAYRHAIVAGRERLLRIEGEETETCLPTNHRFSYDTDNGRRTFLYDQERNIYTSMDYDSRDLEIERVEVALLGSELERTTDTLWHPTLRLPTRITRDGQRIELTYDAFGRELTRTLRDTQTQSVPYSTVGNTRTTTMTYNAEGLVETIDGPRTDLADITTFAYLANGFLSSVTNPLGHAVQILAHNDAGQPTQIQDENGIISNLAYDDRQRLLSRTVVHPTGDATTSFEYNEFDDITRLTQPDGTYLDFGYDADRFLRTITAPNGDVMEYGVDAAGNIVQTQAKDSGGVVSYVQQTLHDELSRLRQMIGANGQSETFSYDSSSNPISAVDALTRNTEQAFDELNRMVAQTNPSTDSTAQTYDERDNLLTVTDFGGVTTTYVYNGFDEVIQESSPDMGTTVYRYDDAGNLTEMTDGRGVVTQYTYDALNRMLTTSYPASAAENVTYVYDQGTVGIGRLSSRSDESGSTTYTYDHRGNTLTQTRVDGAITLSQAWTYDLADNVQTMTYPSGRVLTYSRDALSRVSGITAQLPGETAQTLVSNVTYAPFGPPLTWTSGNGVTNTRVLDLDYRMENVTIAGTSGSLHQLTYGYDLVDNISAITDGVDLLRDQGFSYDLEDRLETATSHYGDHTYVYDANGNRTQRTRIIDDGMGGTTTKTQNLTYVAGSNRVDLRNSKQVLQDGTGNRISDKNGDKILTYNHANRHTTWTQDGVLEATYVYSGEGQRTKKTRHKETGDKHQHFYYDQNGQWLGNLTEKIGGGTAFFDYVWLDDIPLVRLKQNVNTSGVFTSTKTTWLHADHLNTPRIGTDDAQTIVWRWDSDPFGLGGIDSDPDGDGTKHSIPLRFPGQYKDGESGLTYNYFRTYDASIGRYTQSDPIGLLGGLNRYAYVGGNPLNYLDDDGLNRRPPRKGEPGYRDARKARAAARERAAVEKSLLGLRNQTNANRETLQRLVDRLRDLVQQTDPYLPTECAQMICPWDINELEGISCPANDPRQSIAPQRSILNGCTCIGRRVIVN